MVVVSNAQLFDKLTNYKSKIIELLQLYSPKKLFLRLFKKKQWIKKKRIEIVKNWSKLKFVRDI